LSLCHTFWIKKKSFYPQIFHNFDSLTEISAENSIQIYVSLGQPGSHWHSFF